jgi:regulator of cell morphogenesis and NO signaling
MFTSSQPISNIVAVLPSAPSILARFDIDFSQSADQNLEQACLKAQFSVEQVLEKLEDAALTESGIAHPDPHQFTLTQLIRYIVRVHHRYLREEIPHLIDRARNAARRSASSSQAPRAGDWNQMAVLVNRLHVALVMHFEKEEQILFPYIAQMDDAPQFACLPPCSRFKSVAEPVFVMAQEHEFVENTLHEIERLLSNLNADAAKREFAEIFHALKEDLDRHIHLEDDCLFPRAIGAEHAAKEAQ